MEQSVGQLLHDAVLSGAVLVLGAISPLYARVMETPLQRRLTFFVGSVLTLVALVLGVFPGPIDDGRRGRRQLLLMAGLMVVVLGLSWWVGTRS